MSPIRSTPYVNFQGRAREAMEFYRKALGGTLQLSSMSEQGKIQPAGAGERIWHARLESDDVVICASDGHPDYPPQVGNNMAIAIEGKDKNRLSKIFAALADEGRILTPLAKQPWGAEVGWLTDRFGIGWTVEVVGT